VLTHYECSTFDTVDVLRVLPLCSLKVLPFAGGDEADDNGEKENLLDFVLPALRALRPYDPRRNLKSPKKFSRFDTNVSLVPLFVPKISPEIPKKSINP